MPDTLERAIARFRPRPQAPPDDTGARISAAAFRASIAQRIRNLERDVSEVKGRINGLIFVIAGAVLTQLVLRIVE